MSAVLGSIISNYPPKEYSPSFNKEPLPSQCRPFTPEQEKVLELCASEYGCSVVQILSRASIQNAMEGRRAFMYLLFFIYGWGATKIASIWSFPATAVDQQLRKAKDFIKVKDEKFLPPLKRIVVTLNLERYHEAEAHS
ncbi:MAG: hypothetical protein J0M30_14670 [Chitinophagales bacterium]|nr:hypothetical protein [Chitinophagales bacterium]